MIVDVKGRKKDFDESINELNKKMYGDDLSGRYVIMQINAVTISNPAVKLETLSNEEVVSIVESGLIDNLNDVSEII